MAGQIAPFVIAAGDGETVRSPVGGPATFKARAGETGGMLTALESAIPPGEGPPLHIHEREDEAYYVLGGHVTFKAADLMLDAPTGAFVFIPRGTPHCFQNIGGDTAKLLVLYTPSGMERFFEELAELPDGPVDPKEFAALAKKASMTVVGPPLRL